MLDLTFHSILAQVAREESRYVTELRHMPEGWVAVGGLALLALLLWAVIAMYRHEGRVGASAKARGFLACVRCLILLGLAAILLEPVRVKIIRRWIDSYTIVLVDNSSSMGLSDNYRDPETSASVKAVLGDEAARGVKRAEIAARILREQDNGFLRGLADHNRLKVYTFADEPELAAVVKTNREAPAEAPKPNRSQAEGASNRTPNAAETVNEKDADRKSDFAADQDTTAEDPNEVAGRATVSAEQLGIEVDATGPATNLERAFRRAVESIGGSPIAAVVVLTDGGLNQGGSPEEIARLARERRIPLHVIGVGDPSPPRNVRIAEVLAPEAVLQADPFAITAHLAVQGISGESVDVTLTQRESGAGSDQVIERRQVRIGPGGAVVPVEFEVKPETPGRFVYTVTAAPVVDETVEEDNSRQTVVQVSDARTRVLLIAGGPNWNYSYVTHLLERDDTIEVSCWLQSADHSAVRDGDVVIDHLPATAEELFEYDVILLLDPDVQEFTEEWARTVDRMISDQGAGCLYMAARPHSSEFLRDTRLRPLHNLMPVLFDPEAELILNQVGHYQLTPAPIEVPDTAMDHPIMRMADDPAGSRLAWNEIGDVFWHLPVLREKPVATVLMRHGHSRMRNSYGGHVLGAVQYVGAGRTAFLAFDSMWRWRRYGAAYYDRFWVQLIRYLAEGKRLGGSSRATLIVENEQPALGEAVAVSARLLDATFAPLRRDQVVARYQVDGDRGDVVLLAKPDRPGWFEGQMIPDRIGTYRLTLPVPNAKPGDPQDVSKDLVVSRPNLELLHPQMNKAGLTVLAEQSHGGRLWPVDEARDLPAAIPDLHEEIPIRSRPVTLWDNGWVLATLVGLCALEWALRKWNRLL